MRSSSGQFFWLFVVRQKPLNILRFAASVAWSKINIVENRTFIFHEVRVISKTGLSHEIMYFVWAWTFLLKLCSRWKRPHFICFCGKCMYIFFVQIYISFRAFAFTLCFFLIMIVMYSFFTLSLVIVRSSGDHICV